MPTTVARRAQGENLSKGEKLVAGLEHFVPEFGRRGNLHLSRCYRALKGWRRRCPPRSRRPLALSIWSAIIWELCRANYWNMLLSHMQHSSTMREPVNVRHIAPIPLPIIIPHS